MPDKISSPSKKTMSADWLVRGVLTKLGDMFDQFTGRDWKPSSSLATSELIEKLKVLLDTEAKDFEGKGKFVPHNIELKMQWDKFSIDTEQTAESLKKLEYELLTAAIDHINDHRYHTFAPLKIEIKTDYFTEGVKLSAGFDDFGDEGEDLMRDRNEVNVTMPDLKNIVITEPAEDIVEPEKQSFVATFLLNNQPREIELTFAVRERKSVGRTKENDLWLDDASVSKLHAALVLDESGQLIIADTGSTNGTFVNGERIAYGKVKLINEADKLRFGTVEVALRTVVRQSAENEFTG